MSEDSSLEDVIFQGGQAIYNEFNEANSDLLQRLDDWTSFHGLDRSKNPLLTVAHQAAFNVLLKSALYSHYRLSGYDLDSLEGNNIRRCFTDAKSTIGDSAFDECILDDVAFTSDTDALQEIVSSRHLLVDSNHPAEKIGWLFERIILQDSRRKLGQFRTPDHVAEVLADWAITSADDTVLDPGMGAGALTARAYKRKQSLRGKSSVHEMYGVDVNPLAVVMSTTALKLINGEGSPNFTHQDFLKLDPPGSKEHITTSSSSVPTQVDTIVSNPPYSRHHELSQKEKSRIKKRAEEEAGGISLSGRSPLYLYFFIHATQFLKPGGRMAFLTPSEFLETNYGVPLKEYLLDNFDIHAVILHDHDSLTFEDVKTTSCVVLLEREQSPDQKNHTRFIELKEWPDADELLNAIETGSSKADDFGSLWITEQGQLDPEEKWTKYFDPDPVTRFPDLKPLSEIGRLKRGIATGSNDYFCLSDAEVDEWGIEKKYLSPLIRNSTSVRHYDCTTEDFQEWREQNKETWLLYHVDGETISLGEKGVRGYLKHGLKEGADESHLAKSRAVWYRVDRREPADVWATYMTQSGFRFIHNKIDARNLNNLHSIYFDDYSDHEIRAICAYLNSNVVDQIVAQSGRTYAQGLQKVEPNELKEIPVIDPSELTNEQVSHLAQLFDQLCEAARKSDDQEEEVRSEIDEYLAKILNSHQERAPQTQPSVERIQ